MSANLTIGIVFSLVGLLLAAIGIFIWIRTRAFISTAQEVKGTVIRMVASSGSEGGTVYAPVFKFTTMQGQVIEVEERIASNPPEFKTGQVVDILYDPQDPNRARVKKWFNLYFVPLLLGGMGLIFGCIGVVMLVFKIIEWLT
jgi:Protein of unknown function (DUF3592)